jgi:hypothetical protein
MRIGATGHQRRPGLDWTWTAAALEQFLAEQSTPLVGFSSLAAGADQLFARTVLALGGSHVALIPLEGYESCFEQSEELLSYYELLQQSEVINLAHPGPNDAAFLAAGHYIVDRCELLVAIWDGKQAAGRGGTADIVSYAREVGRRVAHLNPFSKSVRRLYKCSA